MKKAMLLMAALALSACGGGSNSQQPTKPSEPTKPSGPVEPTDPGTELNGARGVYQGLMDTGESVTAMVQSDGEFYILVQSLENEGPKDDLSAVIFGTASVDEGTFTSDDAVLRNLDGGQGQPRSVSASYVADEYLTGTITDDATGEAVGFTATSRISGKVRPDLEQLSGDYYGGFFKGILDAAAESEYTYISIGNDNSFVGTRSVIANCGFTGTLATRTDDPLFNVTIDFPNEGCFLGNEVLAGIAYHDEEQNQIFLAVPNADKSGGFFLSGVRAY
ncbi:hypothetical protein SAMN04488073_1256 [Marinobacter gudaonensis]|uniref:Transferrin-binding protein B C-lobe/N-lobe beta barrel domain-containing protein n=1 Tax=Marinobacter gudaonensis TaxID=375760 RepID=A0A1I6GP22_9GAMM|nr:hypothetical protein [Marinobacter gudaonensis]SFR43940.1 hypothetical protein SAMN04488073_1256 [Marinobacter gudaonensis]